jgi:hypothetical protein
MQQSAPELVQRVVEEKILAGPNAYPVIDKTRKDKKLASGDNSSLTFGIQRKTCLIITSVSLILIIAAAGYPHANYSYPLVYSRLDPPSSYGHLN